MNILSKINDWREIKKSLGAKTVGLIPTMGNLHEGHMSLVEQSKRDNDITVLYIFVNPTQFNQAKDFELYPRTREQDIELAEQYGVDYIFMPEAADIYHDEYQVQITENTLSQSLEGEFRPGHFNGMLTVLAKFFNIIQPTRAYFGEKDYQQMLLVKKMVAALFFPLEIIGCKTVRAADDLALSSRNNRLTEAQREKAAHLPRLLQSELSNEAVIAELTALGFKVEYITNQWQRRLAAVWLDDVRLIDNMEIAHAALS